jgi:hypothetical protein
LLDRYIPKGCHSPHPGDGLRLLKMPTVSTGCALHRLRGVFLTSLGADKTQIEASFREAIRIAKQQKAVSLTKCAGATYAEYRSKIRGR